MSGYVKQHLPILLVNHLSEGEDVGAGLSNGAASHVSARREWHASMRGQVQHTAPATGHQQALHCPSPFPMLPA